MKKIITISFYLILAAGIIANGYFMLNNGEPDQLWWWLLAVAFFIWSAVPFVGIAVAYNRITLNLIGKTVLCITAIIITSGTIYVLIESFIIHPDPQSGLIFIFLPFILSIAAAFGVGLALLTKLMKKNGEIVKENNT